MDLPTLLRCYHAALRFKIDVPLNRALGDRMALVDDAKALHVFAPGGAYRGDPLPTSGEAHLRFRIPGEKAHYMVFRPHRLPRCVYWNAGDAMHIDMRDADYADFAAVPAGEEAVDVLRGVVRGAWESARAILDAPPGELERRDVQVAGIAAAARREAQEVIETFRRLGW
jgi:hypothetical protein